MTSRRRASWPALLILSLGCSGAHQEPRTGPNAQGAPTAPDPLEGTAPPEDREAPPPPGLPPEWRFPTVQRLELSNGLGLRVVERHNLPVLEVALVVLTGSAADGAKPGLGVIAGELLKAGGAGTWTSRQLLDRAESLGSGISIVTDRDSTRISMAVTREHFDEALDIIGVVATKPRLDAVEFGKLKRREMDRVESLARTSGDWAASMVLYRELYELPTALHPYSRYDATSKQIELVQLADCRGWHKDHFSPKNAFLVVVGDVTPAAVRTAAERAFVKWTGEAPQKPSFTSPMPPHGLDVYLVDRPGSPQAEILVATLGPERQSGDWASAKTVNQILGGGVAGRLFLDIREKRSLAYRTRSALVPVANGPGPIVLSAGTQTAKAGLALQGLLEHFSRVASGPPSAEEVQIATRFLSDIFLVGVDTVGAVANLTAELGVYNLPDDYYDRYRSEVRQVTGEHAVTTARKYFREKSAVVVVAGDAERLAGPLSHFGPVQVIDPEAEFTMKKKVPHNPTAPIELERIGGT